MTRLTDDEIGDLLRETFADKEQLTNHLPEATNRRRTGPILLAAAAVLVVVAGALYGVQRLTVPDPEPPVASQVVSDTDIWVGAIEATAQRFQPSAGWRQLVLRAASDAQVGEAASRGTAPSDPVRQRIKARVSETVPAHWEMPGPVYTTQACRLGRIAYVSVGNVVDLGDHKEVRTVLTFGCANRYTVTYRVDPSGAQTITDVIGTQPSRVPVESCPTATPATQRAGC